VATVDADASAHDAEATPNEPSTGAHDRLERLRRELQHRLPILAVVLIGIVFYGLLTRGSFITGRRVGFNVVYDAQARSILHGHLDIPQAAATGEAIIIGGRSYAYYGIVPAVLRLPAMLVYPHGSPNVAPWYCMLAYALEAAAAVGIARWARRRAPHASRWAYLWEIAFVVAVAGSASLQLAVRPFVYEEAILWGAAFALATFWALLRLHESDQPRFAILAALAGVGAFGSRTTIGIGCVAALVAFGGILWQRSRRVSATLLGGAVAAVTSFVIVNELRFHTLFSVPLKDHEQYRTAAKRALLRTGPVALHNVPTNLVQYIRPDTLHFQRSFPWVDFRMPRYTPIAIIGHPRFDGLFASASTTATMPLLVVLAVVGVVFAWRCYRPGLALIASGVIMAAPTIGYFGEIERYLTDFVPLLTIAGAIGLSALLIRRGRDTAWLALVALVVAAVSLFVNFALTLDAQRVFNGPPSILGGALPITPPQPANRFLLAACLLLTASWVLLVWWVRPRSKPAGSPRTGGLASA